MSAIANFERMSDAEVASDGAQGSRDDRAAVDKAMCLLLAFGDEAASGIGVSELARRVNLSKSTAFRLLAMLERNGVVEKFGTQYRLGGRLHELGRDVYSPHHDRVRDLLIPFLGDLYERTHHTVHLAALHGTDVVYLAKLHGHRRPSCPSRIGGRVPAHATAVGKALLAHDADASERALSAELPAFTPTTLTQAAELSTELERIRRLGWPTTAKRFSPGSTASPFPCSRRAVGPSLPSPCRSRLPPNSPRSNPSCDRSLAKPLASWLAMRPPVGAASPDHLRAGTTSAFRTSSGDARPTRSRLVLLPRWRVSGSLSVALGRTSAGRGAE